MNRLFDSLFRLFRLCFKIRNKQYYLRKSSFTDLGKNRYGNRIYRYTFLVNTNSSIKQNPKNSLANLLNKTAKHNNNLAEHNTNDIIANNSQFKPSGINLHQKFNHTPLNKTTNFKNPLKAPKSLHSSNAMRINNQNFDDINSYLTNNQRQKLGRAFYHRNH